MASRFRFGKCLGYEESWSWILYGQAISSGKRQVQIMFDGGPKVSIPRKHIQAIEVARLYYEEGRTQADIAAEMGVSRATVSRSLRLAHEIGAVQIRVVDPHSDCSELSEEVKTRFGLQRAIVVPVFEDSPETIKRNIGSVAADYLARIVKPGSVIGVSWGTTIATLVAALRPRKRTGVKIVQLLGADGCSVDPAHINEVARGIAEAFRGDWYLLPAPGVVHDEAIRDALLQEASIEAMLEMCRQADIALVGIGACDSSSGTVHLGYLTPEEIGKMREDGAAGEICYRFYDINGQTLESQLENRVVGITLEDLSSIDTRMGIAGGLGKAEAILGALRGRYVNVLVVDEITARRVIELDDELCIRSDDSDAG